MQLTERGRFTTAGECLAAAVAYAAKNVCSPFLCRGVQGHYLFLDDVDIDVWRFLDYGCVLTVVTHDDADTNAGTQIKVTADFFK